MFQLSLENIHIGQQAASKRSAIEQVAAALTEAGNVAPGYLAGMLAREQQTSTWLGNGIAIPHGTTDTRDRVLKTGVQIFQFPDGIDWGEDQTAYIVIGIAARSDEHLGLLRQLTHVLSNDSLCELLRTAQEPEAVRALLMGERQTPELIFDARTQSLAVETSDMMTLQALNAGRLRALNAVDAAFVSDVVTQQPLYLDHGIWLNDSQHGNLISAFAVARPLHPFDVEGQSVAMLITVAVADEQPLRVLSHLSDLLGAGKAAALLNADATALPELLTGDLSANDGALSAEFTVRNEHGLHARPGTALVNIIKQYSSEITVMNLDGTGKPANGRSLMKVIALGVKKGDRLRFSARGDDAAAALDAIGAAIAAGLGEGGV